MNLPEKRWASLLLVMGMLAACGPAERAVTTGPVVAAFDFESPGSFEEADYGRGVLRIADGLYHIDLYGAEEIVWGQAGGTSHMDTVVEVQAQVIPHAVQPLSDEAWYGVICRADLANTGSGYLFTISPGAQYTIARSDAGESRVLVSGGTPAITGGVNLIRAVCVGSYLALYVNGTFVAAASDAIYSSGVAGLAAGHGTFSAVFDNLAVYSAVLAE